MQTVKKQTNKKKPFEIQEKHAVPAGQLSSLLLIDLLVLGYANLATFANVFHNNPPNPKKTEKTVATQGMFQNNCKNIRMVVKTALWPPA